MFKLYSDANKTVPLTVTKKHFVFLQGPLGPFFKELASYLRSKTGIKTTRINFSGGDWLDWHDQNSVPYKDSLVNWPAWLEDFFEQQQATDLVLFGDCRPYHKIAIELARKKNIKLHLFEEGYLRPQWITHENQGINGFSGIKKEFLAHDPNDLLDLDIESEQCGKITSPMVRLTIKHYLALFALRNRYPHFVTHRKSDYVQDFIAWLKWGTLIRQIRQKQDNKKCAAFIKTKQPFFLLPLQLEYDAQVLHHSNYSDYQVFVEEVIESFAQHAPKEHILMIKTHPLDNHKKSWKQICENLAKKHQVSNRLLILEGGHLPTILDWAKGAVMLNSTVGIQAIHHGCPTIAIGDATYDLPELTNQKPLSEFWNSPEPPSQKRYLEFFRFMIATSQVNGSFYSKKGRELVWQNKIIRFMLNDKCNQYHINHNDNNN